MPGFVPPPKLSPVLRERVHVVALLAAMYEVRHGVTRPHVAFDYAMSTMETAESRVRQRERELEDEAVERVKARLRGCWQRVVGWWRGLTGSTGPR